MTEHAQSFKVQGTLNCIYTLSPITPPCPSLTSEYLPGLTTEYLPPLDLGSLVDMGYFMRGFTVQLT